MAWWKRASSGQAETGAGAFQWNEETVAAFMEGFHDHQDGRRFDLKIELTHQCVQQSSWDLSSVSFDTATDERYFGWCELRALWRGKFGVWVPVQLLLVHRPEQAYEPRSSTDWNALGAIGTAYLWKRGRDREDATHGVEATLCLDSQGYRQIHGALRHHTAPIGPAITLGLRMHAGAPPQSTERSGQSAVAAHEPFDIVAYWITTWPLWVGPAASHPWTRDDR